MPHQTEQIIDGYAHCGQPRCPGSNQEQVKAVRRETSHTYREQGGNAPGVERSFVSFHFADPDQRACPACARAREITDQPRKTYAPLSGFDPLGLLEAAPFDPAKTVELSAAPVTDEERAGFQAQQEEMQQQLVRMAAQLEELKETVPPMDPEDQP